jgi:non-ribosomal peptide synthetase component F
LKKLTRDSELIVGVPFSGRDRQELERVMGVFVNLISIRIDLKAISDFRNLVAKIREKSLEAYKNGKYPFDLLVEKLNPERRSGRNPIFSTVFQFEFMPSANQIPLIDISVCGQEVDNEIEIRVNYDAGRLTKDSIETLASYFMSILRTVVETPDLSLPGLEQIVGEYEKTERLRKVESQGRLNLANLRSARREPITLSTWDDRP